MTKTHLHSRLEKGTWHVHVTVAWPEYRADNDKERHTKALKPFINIDVLLHTCSLDTRSNMESYHH